MTIPNLPNPSEEDKIIEAALAEIREQELSLNTRKAELIAKQRENEARKRESVPVSAIAKFVEPFVTITFDNTRTDLTDFLRTLQSRKYEWNTKVNTLSPADYFNLLAWAVSRPAISIRMDDVSKRKLDEFQKRPDFDIWDDGRVIKIKRNVQLADWKLKEYLKNLSNVAGKYDVYSINRSDAYQLIDFLEYAKSMHYKVAIIPDVLAYAQTQSKTRNSLRDLALLQDTEYDVTIHCGYTLEPLQRVAAKFTEEAKRVIIADPMGMGKSLEEIAPAIKNGWRTLIVCPAFLVDNWTNYVKMYTGQMPYIMEGTSPAEYVMLDLLTNKKQYNIINYESLSRPIEIDNPNSTSWQDKKIERNLWVEMLNASKFDYVISDEAHYIKNIDSARSKAVRQIMAPRMAFLTGTPLLNRPKELFPMLNTLYPVEFPSQKAFEDAYCDGGNGVRNVEQLRNILANIMLRRKNPKVANINPIPVTLRLSADAAKRYEKVLAGIYETVMGGRYDVQNVLVELMRLKQVCADDTVANTVEQAIDARESYDPDEKHNGVLIFSQFLESCHTIAADLRSEGCRVAIIEGATDMNTRTRIVADFQSGHYDFLVGTRAMGEGLNITRAGTVIFNDLLWNKAGHDQFSGRAFGRTGDHHGGNEYWMLKTKTIVEDIYGLVQSKDLTSKQVVDGEFLDDAGESSVVNALIRKIRES